MGKFRFSIAMSLDGFVAGPDQNVENPLGIGGEQLHEWAYGLEAFRRPHGMEGGEVNASGAVLEERLDAGAAIMGRNMFGEGPGPLDEVDIDLVPILLYGRTRLLDGLAAGIRLEQMRAIEAPA